MLLRLFTLSVSSLLLMACSTMSDPSGRSEGVPFETGIEPDVVWSPADWPEILRADIHYPRTGGERPGVLMVHGGGWERRSRSDMQSTAEKLAEAGYVVMNVDYRFAPEYQFPAQLHDMQLAMRWFRAQAEQLGVDPQRIGAWGFSSGAHLVSMLALTAGQGGELDEPYGGESAKVAAVVAGGLPADFTLFDSGRRLVQLMGGTEQQMTEAYREASPVTHVRAGAPPFFLFHGSWDRLVPIEQAEVFLQALDEQGVESRLHRQPLRGHLLGFVFSGAATREGIEFLDAQLIR